VAVRPDAHGDLVVDRVVPEGFEDLSCEALVPIQVQVKSRQERIGDFGVAAVTGFVLKMVQTRAKRRASSEQMVLVLERPVVGAETGAWDETLADLGVDNPLRTAAVAALSSVGHSDDEVDSILAAVSVVVLPWHEAAAQTADMVLTRVDVPRAAAGPMVSALRDAVAMCIDQHDLLAPQPRCADCLKLRGRRRPAASRPLRSSEVSGHRPATQRL
jgi:hypothetical protein